MLDYTTTKIENFFCLKGKKYSTNLKKKKANKNLSGERFKIFGFNKDGGQSHVPLLLENTNLKF